jgi:hypothetical protein
MTPNAWPGASDRIWRGKPHDTPSDSDVIASRICAMQDS